MALRKAPNVWIEKRAGIFSTSYRVRYKSIERFWSKDDYEAAASRQEVEPVLVLVVDENYFWWYQDAFYLDSDKLDSEEVSLILWDRERKHRRRLERLRKERSAVREAEEALKAGGRGRIPSDVRQLVWARDGGKCVECGSADDLQFDHVIPVSRGGGNSAKNLQLLCGPCNREKSNHIV